MPVVESAVVLGVAGLVALLGVRIGMLVAPWVGRHGGVDDEESSGSD